ncbi:unnamed protein product, partial [Rotaria socialis]
LASIPHSGGGKKN